MPSLKPDSESVSGGKGIISELPTRRIFLVISTGELYNVITQSSRRGGAGDVADLDSRRFGLPPARQIGA